MSSTPLAVKAPSLPACDPPHRLLLGPGPSNAHPRVTRILATPQLGHLDPYFMRVVRETSELLRYCWQTTNEVTFPVSGTGTAAMETAVLNSVFPGDVMLVVETGYFGQRLGEMGVRYGAKVHRLNTLPWGTAYTYDAIAREVAAVKPKVLAVVHAETSTGVLQPLEGLGDLCRAHDCLLLVDSVSSIGGAPILVDEYKIDVCYAGGQKSLSCPPGVSPVTFSPRAVAKMDSRKGLVPSFYLDATLLRKYLVPAAGTPAAYHHTAPIPLFYAFHEALRVVAEETLPVSWARHAHVAATLWSGLEAMGLTLLVAKEHRLPTLTTVMVPEGVSAAAVIGHMRDVFGIDLGGGLGQLAGKVFRIGMMGYNSRVDNVALLLSALAASLTAHGFPCAPPKIPLSKL